MECYYKSKLSGERGYIQRMHDLWIKEGMVVVSKKRLVDQAYSILNNQMLSEDELKEIRDRVGFQEEEPRKARSSRPSSYFLETVQGEVDYGREFPPSQDDYKS